ncbi:lipoprotein insertase outer membrane protein LolB [Leptothrix ochracea]|uniref:lipoprotein insertase outer membrane protein LolB n=1 Tax=Leptothrix ochracea TaxID=735331 RepID=UPI0034E2898B
MSASPAFSRRDLVGAALAATLFSGCATPPPSITKITSGRMAMQVVNDASRSFNADFELQGSADRGQLLLSGMLGTRLAQATWTPTRVTLSTGSEQHTFQSLDHMALAVFGESIPLTALFDWIEGRPWPQAASEALPDKTPGFQQMGWTIDLQRLNEGRILAQRAAATAANTDAGLAHPELRLRIRLDRP